MQFLLSALPLIPVNCLSVSSNTMSANQEIPKPVLQCVEMLKSAETDNDKLASLFLIAKLIKADQCDKHCLKMIYDAVGFTFLNKLLRSEVPADCPPFMYKDVAMSIVSCFCTVEEIIQSPAIISIVPVLLQIVAMSDDEDMEDNLMLVSDCYACLEAIARSENGRKALLEHGALDQLADIYIEEMFRHDQALHLLACLASFQDKHFWTGNEELLRRILTRAANEFAEDTTERKFELCRIMAVFLGKIPQTLTSKEFLEDDWPKKALLALESILSNRLGTVQRDHALVLTSRMLDLFGVRWGMKATPNPRTFLLLLINLACIEVRMKLEDKTMEQAIEAGDVIVACYLIMENFITFMVTQEFLEFDSKQREQAYCALKGAVGAILSVLYQTSIEHDNTWKLPLADLRTGFVYSAVRVIGCWLSEETTSMKDDVISVLPFIIGFCKRMFEETKSGNNDMPEALRFMLPAFCHLTAEDAPRKILLEQKTTELLYDYTMYQWSIFSTWLAKEPKVASDWLHSETAEQEIIAEKNRPESESAVILACGVFMNIAVLEPELVTTDPVFAQILKFCISNVPSLVHRQDFVVLLGNVAVLGLLVLRHLTWRYTHGDSAVFRFIQACVSFLWDAHNSEDSADSLSLVISLRYKKDWPDLAELWFLGMQALSNVMGKLDWIVDFIVDSGWPQEMMKSLSRIISGAIDANTRTAYEDFLCCLVRAQPVKVKAIVMENGGKKTCRTHQMKQLIALLDEKPAV